jgi:hypothetical protein
MTNQNVTANYNTRRLKLYGQFDFNTPHVNFKGNSSNSIADSGRVSLLSRQTNRSYKINFYTYEAGLDWDITQRHQVSARYNGHFDDFVAPKRSDVRKYNPDNNSFSALTATTNIVEPYYFDHLNLGYRYKLDSAGALLSVDMHWMKYKNFSDGFLLSEPADTNHGSSQRRETLFFHQPGFITIRSAKADILLPFPKISFKAGIKASLVNNDNQFRFDSLSQGTLSEAKSMSNHFKYREAILAGYLSVSKKLEKTSLEAGIRIEHTDARGYTVKADVDNRWAYLQFFPSISLDQKIGENNKLNISVSRRINRPQYNDLNPVRWYNDPYFYYSGNPDLQAELAWVFSTAFSFRNGLSLTGTFNRRTNFISTLLTLDSQTTAIKSITANFREMNRLDLLALLPVQITDFWNVNLSGTLTHTSYPLSMIDGLKHLALWSTSVSLQQRLTLPLQVQMEVSAVYVSDELQGIYRRSQNFYADVGVKKSMLGNRLSILLNYTDFLRTNRYKAKSLSDFTDYQIYERKDTNRFGISIRYHIGNSSGGNKSNKTEEQERV